ncbi:MAG: polysaccharide deacetylase family protein [Clostridia bacterium]
MSNIIGINGMVKKKFKRVWYAILIIAVCACIILGLYYFFGYKNSGEAKIFLPIKSVMTEQSLYSVTINLIGSENVTSKRLINELFGGFKIKATYFVTTEYIEKNTSEITAYLKNGHSVGLYLQNVSAFSKTELMRFIALENDKFYALTGRYPRLVRETGQKNSYTGEILDLYGQIFVSSNANVTNCTALKKGDILEIETLNEEAAYALARLVSQASTQGLLPEATEKLINLQNTELKWENIFTKAK